jgi:hypothetical protein
MKGQDMDIEERRSALERKEPLYATCQLMGGDEDGEGLQGAVQLRREDLSDQRLLQIRMEWGAEDPCHDALL